MLIKINLAPYTPFIDNICAAPAAKIPRLALAHWLAERGQVASADNIRSWVALWQHLIPEWERGRAMTGTVRDIPDVALPAGILAAVMVHRLTLTTWPIPWDRITAWADGWDAVRARKMIDESLILTELVALGVLPAEAAAAARSAAASVADAATRTARYLPIARAVEVAAHAAGWAAFAAAAEHSPVADAGALASQAVVQSAISAVHAAVRAADAEQQSAIQYAAQQAAASLYQSSCWKRLI